MIGVYYYNLVWVENMFGMNNRVRFLIFRESEFCFSIFEYFIGFYVVIRNGMDVNIRCFIFNNFVEWFLYYRNDVVSCSYMKGMFSCCRVKVSWVNGDFEFV